MTNQWDWALIFLILVQLLATITNTDLSQDDNLALANSIAAIIAGGDQAQTILTQLDINRLQNFYDIMFDENKLRILENESFVKLAVTYYL